MITGTALKTVNGRIKNGVLTVSLSFITTDQAEYRRLENLKELQTLVEIDIREVRPILEA